MKRLIEHKWLVLAIILAIYVVISFISILNEQMECGSNDYCLGTRVFGDFCLGIRYGMNVDCF